LEIKKVFGGKKKIMEKRGRGKNDRSKGIPNRGLTFEIINIKGRERKGAGQKMRTIPKRQAQEGKGVARGYRCENQFRETLGGKKPEEKTRKRVVNRQGRQVKTKRWDANLEKKKIRDAARKKGDRKKRKITEKREKKKDPSPETKNGEGGDSYKK